MPACDECNRGTSTADLTAAVVSRWNYDGLPQARADHGRLVAQVRKQAPELIAEWAKNMSPEKRKGAILHLIEYGIRVPADAGVATIGPVTIRQLNVFAHKAPSISGSHCRKRDGFALTGRQRKTSREMAFRKFYSTTCRGTAP